MLPDAAAQLLLAFSASSVQLLVLPADAVVLSPLRQHALQAHP